MSMMQMSGDLPDKLDIKVESGATRNDVTGPLVTIAQLGWNNQTPLLTYNND
jgi:hypothetical protein